MRKVKSAPNLIHRVRRRRQDGGAQYVSQVFLGGLFNERALQHGVSGNGVDWCLQQEGLSLSIHEFKLIDIFPVPTLS